MDDTQTNLLSAVSRSNNTRAWGEFHDIYAPMLRSFCRRLGLSDAEVEDVTQEVLMVVLRSLRCDAYDRSKGRFRAWLYGITRRQALAALRKRHRRTRVQSGGRPEGVDLLDRLEAPSSEAALREIWRQEWRYSILEEALRHVESEVGAKVFRAFRRFAMDGTPAEQVAEELSIAPSSVYVYKGRVLSAVRRWVARIEKDDSGSP